jgi:hypothetical protein
LSQNKKKKKRREKKKRKEGKGKIFPQKREVEALMQPAEYKL